MILPFKTNRLYKVLQWASGDSSSPSALGKKVRETDDLNEADIVTSEIRQPMVTLDDVLRDGYVSLSDTSMHTPVLDIDVPAQLIPSSTPGKHHLYLDVPMSWETYIKLLDVMAEAGILEPGYVNASKERGFTAVRLPWIRKG